MLNQHKTGVAIVGSGSARLSSRLTNDELSRLVETDDEWIASRTGIRSRHLAGEEGSVKSLAAAAGRDAIAMAGLAPTDLQLIILATSTPDDLFGTAAQVQAELGATHAAAFDLTAACSGFVVALVTAAQFMRSGVYQNILVIGADVLSRWTDWSDRRTCVLFGDGAGAVVLRAAERDRLLGFELCSDGSMNSCLNLAYVPESQPLLDGVTVQKGTFSPISMNGREVYKFAVSRVPEVLEKALFRADLTAADVNWWVLHQANQRIL
ncbi:MAG TPA: beta-ketoacyl-ACP synthase 3, partial [Trichocoleus sp.]